MLAWLKIKLIKYIVRPTLLGLVVLTVGGILVFYFTVLRDFRSVVSKQADKLVSNPAIFEKHPRTPHLTPKGLSKELEKFETEMEKKIEERIKEHSLNPEKQVDEQVDGR